MPIYNYIALDKDGAKIEGQQSANSVADAIKIISSNKLNVIECKEQASSNNVLRKKVGLKEIEFLTSELSLLLESGIRIDKGLDIIKKNKSDHGLSQVINDISNNLHKGASLYESFALQPNLFDQLYCNLVKLGESAGNLPEVFARLSEELKFKRDLNNKLLGSLLYPAVIFFVCILAIVFIFNFVIPRMAGIFEGAQDIPWYTEVLLNTSAWMLNYQFYLLLGIILIILGIYTNRQNHVLNDWWQRFVLNLPYLGGLVMLAERIRFCSGLSLMLNAGLQADKALGLSEGSIRNKILKNEIEVARKKIREGGGVSYNLGATALFPDYYVSLLEVGEESGNLTKVFNEIAIRSRQELEESIKRLTTILEPLMILFMGLIVGGVVIVMLLSMTSMNDVGL